MDRVIAIMWAISEIMNMVIKLVQQLQQKGEMDMEMSNNANNHLTFLSQELDSLRMRIIRELERKNKI